jgi:hypothetical protein
MLYDFGFAADHLVKPTLQPQCFAEQISRDDRVSHLEAA